MLTPFSSSEVGGQSQIVGYSLLCHDGPVESVFATVVRMLRVPNSDDASLLTWAASNLCSSFLVHRAIRPQMESA